MGIGATEEYKTMHNVIDYIKEKYSGFNFKIAPIEFSNDQCVANIYFTYNQDEYKITLEYNEHDLFSGFFVINYELRTLEDKYKEEIDEIFKNYVS
jgi:hypothetical protein